MVHNHNKVVAPNDKVYFLGDVTMRKKHLPILGRMNGKKVLVKGNHDMEGAKEYLKYFYDLRGSHVLDKYILTHIPIHTASIERWNGNIHGHLHSNKVMMPCFDVEDPRYFCASVENINYTPIPFEDVKRIMRERN